MTKASTLLDAGLRIGAVASRTGVTVETLRYYERRGLIRPTARRDGGYREYGNEIVAHVQFIKRAQALGFTLAEVAELVRLRLGSWTDASTGKLRAAAISKIQDIDHRLGELTSLRGELDLLLKECNEQCPEGAVGVDPNDCSFVKALEGDETHSPRPDRRPARPKVPATQRSPSTRRER